MRRSGNVTVICSCALCKALWCAGACAMLMWRESSWRAGGLVYPRPRWDAAMCERYKPLACVLQSKSRSEPAALHSQPPGRVDRVGHAPLASSPERETLRGSSVRSPAHPAQHLHPRVRTRRQRPQCTHCARAAACSSSPRLPSRRHAQATTCRTSPRREPPVDPVHQARRFTRRASRYLVRPMHRTPDPHAG